MFYQIMVVIHLSFSQWAFLSDSGRSDRSRSAFLHSAFAHIKNSLKFTQFSSGQLLYITFTGKIEVTIFLKIYILVLSDLTKSDRNVHREKLDCHVI